MTVFDKAYRDEVLARYSRLPERDWPLGAKVAALDPWEETRVWIEATTARLDSRDQPKITHLLRGEQFLTTLGELVVGWMLFETGCAPRYEQRYETVSGPLSPDWSASHDGGCFVCDVFTAGLLEERASDTALFNSFTGRLQTINEPVLLELTIVPSTTMNPAQQKRLANDVAAWIRAGVQRGSEFASGGVRIRVLGDTSKHVLVIGFEPMHIVPTPESVRKTIKEKAKKYEVLGLPMLIAAVRHPSAEMDSLDFENAVAGNSVYRSVQLTDGRIVGGEVRESGGAFERRPELAAAMLVEPWGSYTKLPVHLFRNEASTRPLPESLLDGLGALAVEIRK